MLRAKMMTMYVKVLGPCTEHCCFFGTG